jgi:hypothetical protein
LAGTASCTTARKLRHHFVTREFSIAVLVQLGKCRCCVLDFGSGNLTIAIGIQCCQHGKCRQLSGTLTTGLALSLAGTLAGLRGSLAGLDGTLSRARLIWILVALCETLVSTECQKQDTAKADEMLGHYSFSW